MTSWLLPCRSTHAYTLCVVSISTVRTFLCVDLLLLSDGGRGTDGTADASVIAFRISSSNLSSKCFVFSLRDCPALRLHPCHPLSRDPSICYLATVSKATKLPCVCRPHLHISRPASLCSFVSAADCMDGEGTHSQKAQSKELLVCTLLSDSLKEITYEWGVKGVQRVGLLQHLGVALFLLLY